VTITIGRPVLEVGSNIFELVEFVLSPGEFPDEREGGAQNSYGVNVAKVREVIRLPTIVPCLTTCPAVLGVFNLRGHPIPVIHLAKALGVAEGKVSEGSQVIVTEFSRRLAGFVVAGTKRIRRVSWDKVLPPSSETFGHMTGMMLIENSKFIFILDFEKILLEIEGSASTGTHAVSAGAFGVLDSSGSGATSHANNAPLVMVVDDSPTARRSLTSLLESMGMQCVTFTNGDDAWRCLKESHGFKADGGLKAIISDVEMPKLDGYSLAKRIRQDPEFKGLAFLLHSSLTGQVNKDRALEAGADAYVTKFNKKEIFDALRRFLPTAFAGKAS
jgi:two-component system chemotaxis response regulator CheV